MISMINSFLARLRGGEYGLWKTFWLSGVLAFVAVYNLLMLFAEAIGVMDEALSPNIPGVIALLFLVAFSVIYFFNAYMGIWKAADLYKGPGFWRFLAKLVLFCLFFPLALVLMFEKK